MPNKRRGGSGTVAERKNSGGWPRRTCRKVIPTDQLVSVLENLLAPGDRVVLEGNNQKQADFLSRMLAEVNPQKIHDLHMIMPSVGRSEHLDLFEKGIARKLDFSFSGTQSLRISQLLEDGLLEIGAIHTYIELYSRLYVDLSPNVALIAGYKADRKGNLYTGPSTEDTPALVEAAAFHDGIVIAQSTNWWTTNATCRASIFPARGLITWWSPTNRSSLNRSSPATLV